MGRACSSPRASVVGVSYDGKGFNFVTSSGYNGTVTSTVALRRFDATLTAVAGDPDDGVIIRGNTLIVGSTYGLASDGNGCTFVAYVVNDIDRLGYAIEAQFIN